MADWVVIARHAGRVVSWEEMVSMDLARELPELQDAPEHAREELLRRLSNERGAGV